MLQLSYIRIGRLRFFKHLPTYYTVYGFFLQRRVKTVNISIT